MILTQAHEFGHEHPEANTGLVRILIADIPIVRFGLRKLLTLESDFDVVGEACDAREVLEKVHHLTPDILLFDLWMPNLDGLATLEELRRSEHQTQVIVFAASEYRKEFVHAIKLGCRGILLKESDPELIRKGIRKVKAGEMCVDPHTTSAVMNEFSGWVPSTNGAATVPRERNPLSPREREIVQLVAQGYKNKEMAEKMFISEQTVKNHLHNIFDKLGVSDRLELALYAIHKEIHLNGNGPVPKALPQPLRAARL